MKFLAAVLSQPRVKRLLSSEHFSVDGTLIQAWASMKSFKAKDPHQAGPSGGRRNAPANFRGEKRSNATHRSTTDPNARLYRKGPGMEARLCFIGHGLMENRSALTGGYDAADFVEELRGLNVRPHVAQNRSGRRSAIDLRTTRHPGPASGTDCGTICDSFRNILIEII